MKKNLAIIICILAALQLMACGGKKEDVAAKKDILAIYNNPNSQVLSDDGISTTKANSVSILYTDNSYIQYVLHDGKCEEYSEGTFDFNFDWDTVEWGEGDSHIMTYNATKTYLDGEKMQNTNMSNDVNLDKLEDYCLYPDNAYEDVDIEAIYLQDKAQKYEKQDGTEIYIATAWIYYVDGTFQQYALTDKEEEVLFSEGDYHFSKGSFGEEDAVITIHRTSKYVDGQGLSDYDSTHDYELETLGFVRVYP